MNHSDRLWTALGGPEPARRLRTTVLELHAEGCSKREIQALLETLLQESRLRENHGEAQEDAILDVLDSLAGWCHSTAHLLPDGNVK